MFISKHRFISMWILAIVVLVITGTCELARASEDAINKYTTYATVLGRASGCGINAESEYARVGAWFDRAFIPGTSQHTTHLRLFMFAAYAAAKDQAEGRTPDTCEEVRKQIRTFPWP